MANKPTVNLAPRARLLVNARTLCSLLGVSRTRFDELVPLMPRPIRFGPVGSRYWRVEEVRAWINAGMPPPGSWEWMPTSGVPANETVLVMLLRIESALSDLGDRLAKLESRK